jgi:formiminotetrahydrofolate cyclodeaminase
MADQLPKDETPEQKARREFLIRCGRFAAVTPPAMVMLLDASTVPSEAHASTIGWQNNQGQNRNNQGQNKP